MPIHDPAFLAAFGATPEDARARLEQELAAFEAAVRAQPDWLAPLPGRPWSPAQLAEHVLLVNEGASKAMHLLGSDRPLPELPRPELVVIGGKNQAPPSTQPGPGLPWAELEPRWQSAHARMLQTAGGVDAVNPRTIWHPGFGDLSALNWLRVSAFHTRHHRKQLPG